MKRIELEKGKAGIVLPSAEELPKLIEGLIAAVGRGELDSQLQAVSLGRAGKGRGGSGGGFCGDENPPGDSRCSKWNKKARAFWGAGCSGSSSR